MSLVTSIHHIAFGVNNLEKMRDFYTYQLGFTKVIMEFNKVSAPIMSEVARTPDLVFSGVILEHENGGILLELIEKITPSARPIRTDYTYGDIGLNGFSMIVENSQQFCALMDHESVGGSTDSKDNQVRYLHDPEGNIIRIEQADNSPRKGMRGAILGVSDIDQSLIFYRDLLGFSTNIQLSEHTGVSLFSRSGQKISVDYRSARLFDKGGESWLELIQTQPTGRPIPFATNWGDLGGLQICFSCSSASEVATILTEAKGQLLCSPHPAGEGSVEETGEFVYGLDPDGAPTEFLSLPG